LAKDPASVDHFLSVNRVMGRLVTSVPVSWLLTDFQVRVENMHYGKAGFAEDYDAVFKCNLPNKGILRASIEFERSRRSATRCEELCRCLETEKNLHARIMVVDKSQMADSLAPFFKRLGVRICFISLDDFLLDGIEAYAKFWMVDDLLEAPVRAILATAGKRTVATYAPFSRLVLR
jgi:hypothetical protein